MFTLDYNPCSKRNIERFSQLPIDKQEQIAALSDGTIEASKLIKLKRNRKPVEVHEGDVFLVSNKEGLYFYGKVIQCVNTKHDRFKWSEECYVGFIFKCTTREKNLNNFVPNYDDCVCGPELFDVSFWGKGYFEIVGNIPLTKAEKKLDIGFFDGDSKSGVFFSSQGKMLWKFPRYFGMLAFITFIGVSIQLSIAYVVNPELLIE